MKGVVAYDVVAISFAVALGAAGTHAELARRAGVSDEVISQVVRGRRPITGKLLRYLGFERVPAFRRIAQ